MTPLRATLRLQLHAGFPFAAAQAQLDHAAELGISHLYLSPIAQAVPGSTHGYDGIEPGRISEELGGEAGFVALAQAARARGLGIILDWVPNHLAADTRNPWWNHVLTHGRRSGFADWFDIEWVAPGCEGRLWLPVLDRPLAKAVEEGALRVISHHDAVLLEHHGQHWPVCPLGLPDAADLPGWIERCNRTPAHLHRLLEHQAYRLAWWRSGQYRINYRRFFDINGLVALKVERADVFSAVHGLPLRLAREGWIDGLRIDHIDGLANPPAYLQQLRTALDEAGTARGLGPGTLTLHVEKILADGESLPASWTCDGTTGYDFMDQVSAVLHDAAGRDALEAAWNGASGHGPDAHASERQARDLILGTSLQADLDRCLRSLQHGQTQTLQDGDLAPRMLERALRALLRHFPVYRTYGLHDAQDRGVLEQACTAAAADLDGGGQAALGWLRQRLLSAAHGDAEPEPVVRLEQLSAPLNAKAVEDTTFYRYGRLISRNEVGSDPARLALSANDFLDLADARRARFPRALLAVATHDHKRGPDARMRLAVLSAWPQAWRVALAQWQARCLHAGHAVPLPDAEAYLLWQTLVASWPLDIEVEGETFATRVQQWLRKALREAKQISSWSDPDTVREDAACAWVHWLCCDVQARPLRAQMREFLAPVAAAGARLSLAQLALQLTCPGVPDIYQGSEGWDTSLVDPDNRRPVDYAVRRTWLDDPRSWHGLLNDWRGGAPKARLLRELLQLRRVRPALFAHGTLHPVAVEPHAGVLLFARRWERQFLLVGVRTRPGSPQASCESLVAPAAGDEHALLQALPPGRYRNVLDDRAWSCTGEEISIADLFNGSPVAVWIDDVERDDGR